MTKAVTELLVFAWERAFVTVLEEAGGKASPLYKMLGSLAWGRYEYEASAHGRKADETHRAVGYLKGVRDTALAACQIMGLEKEEDLLRNIHRRIDEILARMRQ